MSRSVRVAVKMRKPLARLTPVLRQRFPGGAGCLRELPLRSSELGRYGTSFRSLFGEPVPGLVTTLEVAPATRAAETCAGVAEVWLAR